MSERKAGSQLIAYFLNDPLGEELLEGTAGGLMAGATQLGSDQSLGQTALETAAAIAGGIGVGMLGRRIGARVGRQVHKDALKQQDSMLATIGRTLGSETTVSGLRDQGAMMKNTIQEALVNESSARLAREAVQDPAGFANRYGLSAEMFKEYAPAVQAGRTAMAAAESLKAMPPELREQALKKLAQYEAVEKLITGKAAGSMDEMIASAADAMDSLQKELNPDDLKQLETVLKDKSPGDAMRSLLNPVQPITGEHVGRAVGRMIGDEVGILGGMAAGSLLAQQLGMDSPKDKKIRELEQQLAGRG